jgi:hypothetical protein
LPPTEGAHRAVGRHGDERALGDVELLAAQRELVDSDFSAAVCSAGSIEVSTTRSCSMRPTRSSSTSMIQSAT